MSIPEPSSTSPARPAPGRSSRSSSRERVRKLTAIDGKAVVRRLIDDVLVGGDLDAIEELYTPAMARRARRWIEPFLASFSDIEMEVVQLVSEGEVVAARFRCSGTHTGTWLGRPPSGRRFERIDEVYFFTVRDGRICEAWGLEDTLRRKQQLGVL